MSSEQKAAEGENKTSPVPVPDGGGNLALWALNASKSAAELIDNIREIRVKCMRYRVENEDLLPIGPAQAFALEVAEAILLKQVEKDFEGVKSNAEQRAAYLTGLKTTDDNYKRVKEMCGEARKTVDEMEAALEAERLLIKLQLTTINAVASLAGE